MDTNKAEALRLDAFHNQNWRVDAGPVAILNQASTTHERIAFCWGLAAQIDTLAQMLATANDRAAWPVGGLLQSFATPLVAMLDRLANDSRTDGRA